LERQEERRKFVRLNTWVDITYKKKTSDRKLEDSLLRGAKNISQGGICLIAYEPLKVGDILELQIYLPDQPIPIEVVGKVVWVQEFFIGDYKRYDVGVEFIEISEEKRNLIGKYVFSILRNFN